MGLLYLLLLFTGTEISETSVNQNIVPEEDKEKCEQEGIYYGKQRIKPRKKQILH
jgi:hypothetical protein